MIKATLVLIAGLAAAAVLRRRPAALRHRVLVAALACSAMMPLAEVAVPGWHIALLPSAVRPAEAMRFGDGEAGRLAEGSGNRGARGHGANWPLLELLPLVWGGGVAMGLLWLGTGLVRVAWTTSRAREITEGPWTRAATLLARRSGLNRPPLILQTRHPGVLFTWGIRRPKILLPGNAEGWSEERIRIVLGHEMAHIRRRDWPIQLLAHVVRSIYWFNPLAWMTCRRLRLESEHACDDEVLRLGVTAPDYATELLSLACAFRQVARPFISAPAMARPSELERRVRVMLNPRLDRAPVRRSSALLAWLGMIALTVPLAGLSIRSGGASAVQTTPALSPPASSQPADRVAGWPAGKRQAAGAATFAGTVVDQSGRAIPSLPITLTQATTSATMEHITDHDGRFAVPGLVPGAYEVRISKPGFKTAIEKIELRAGDTLRREVVLHLGMLSETIVVTTKAGAPTSVAGMPKARHVAAPPAQDSCAHATGGGCVTPPIKIADAKPIYPVGHAAAGVSGEVVIAGRVLPDGSAGDLQPRPGADADFATAAMRAIRLWKFTPTRLNGEPVAVEMTVTVKFQIAR